MNIRNQNTALEDTHSCEAMGSLIPELKVNLQAFLLGTDVSRGVVIMEEKLITVTVDWLGAVANLITSCATLSKEGRDLTGQPPEDTLLNIAKCIKQILSDGGETLPLSPEQKEKMGIVSLIAQAEAKGIDVKALIESALSPADIVIEDYIE